MTARRSFLQGCILACLLGWLCQSAHAPSAAALLRSLPWVLTTATPLQTAPAEDSPEPSLQLPGGLTVPGLIQLILIITVFSLAPAIVVMVVLASVVAAVLSARRIVRRRAVEILRMS